MSFGYKILGFGSGGPSFGAPVTMDYLCIAGGGAGGSKAGTGAGGAGAGGYRNSYASEPSGGGSSSQPTIAPLKNEVLTKSKEVKMVADAVKKDLQSKEE